MIRHALVPTALLLAVASPALAQRAQPAGEVERLVASFAGDTPLARDLEALTDGIGGRATGSPANLRAVDWALARFREAGVDARKEAFTMPTLWLERGASATVSGAGVSFSPRVAAMPFSAATPAGGATAPLLDAGRGAAADFARLGERARGAFLLVEQDELKDVDGLFREYNESAAIEVRAFAAGVAGVVYMGSRPYNTLYRHNVAIGSANTRPMLVMERDAAARALRLIRAGTPLTLTERIDLAPGGPYESYNVVGEIRGSEKPDEVVVIGSHLDSWDLGDGALDNGANAVMLIDVARQMKRLGIRPRRTLRFILWNGEEQGMNGSLGYTRTHAAEMDRTVMAAAFDIGCGRVTGFFTGGRPEIVAAVDRTLGPVRGLGPFTHVDVPLVGTDNFDFMLQGVANLVANQEPASYGPNYHARSDTYDKCDIQQLRLNAAITAALAYGLGNADVTWTRQTRAQVEELMRHSDLEQQMRTFNVWNEWAAGTRGRQP
ncbi:MAG: Peptidase [Gemmatimonadetes bacterium]|nr:Peptidase [Gemmatimonadota bacterium]